MVTMVVLLVGGWQLCIIARQPPHLIDIATEVGSIAQFRDGLFPNNKGTDLVYFRETEKGVGAYFCDAAIGSNKLLFEQREKGYNQFLGMLRWSPDDSLFACSVISNPNSTYSKEEIILYNGTSGNELQRIAADGYRWNSFVWLSPHSFAFLISYSPNNRAWLVFGQKPDGTWVQAQVVKRFADVVLNYLTATSVHSIAWQQGREIWTFDFASGSTNIIWESITNKLESFAYSEKTGQFVLACSDENGPISISFRPPRLWEKQGSIVDVTRNDNRTRYADLTIDHGLYSFSVKTDADSEPTNFIWQGMVEYYKLVGDYLYFIGNLANETPSIWQYDIHAKAVRSLLSKQNGDFKYAKTYIPLVGVGTNVLGRQISYHLWRPVQESPRRRYPLIIGQTHYIWNPYQQVAANGGYYYATVDRATWADNIDNWPEDVLGLYDIFKNNPNIDTNRIFLTTFSEEASDAIQVLNVRPNMCKGVILFNPYSEPDLAYAHLSSMFIVGGREDDDSIQQLTKYQDEAAKAGVPVRLVLQDGAQHIARSIATERERTRQFARFLLEN